MKIPIKFMFPFQIDLVIFPIPSSHPLFPAAWALDFSRKCSSRCTTARPNLSTKSATCDLKNCWNVMSLSWSTLSSEKRQQHGECSWSWNLLSMSFNVATIQVAWLTKGRKDFLQDCQYMYVRFCIVLPYIKPWQEVQRRIRNGTLSHLILHKWLPWEFSSQWQN